MTRLCDDPTREDMLDHLHTLAKTEYDIEEAIYWFANDWHSGQGCNLYAALCASPFTPGVATRYIEPESMAACLYDELEARYTTPALPRGWTHIEA